MEPTQPAAEAPPFIPFVDFTRKIYFHETKDLVVKEHLRMFTIHLNTSEKVQNWPYWSETEEGQIKRWLTVYPSLKWVNALTEIYYGLPNNPEIERPAHFILFLPQEDYSTQKSKWSPLMRTGGYCGVTGLSEEGITCLYGDTEIYIPARPTDSQLKNKFIQTLRAYITDELRDEFIKYHFHSYTVNPRAFVDYIRSIVTDEDLFSTGDWEPIRAYLLQWVQRQQAHFQEIDSLKNPQAFKGNPAPEPAEDPRVFKLNYGLKNAEVICTLYEELNGSLFNSDFEQWERLFIDNKAQFQAIIWKGKETQLVTLFQGLKLDTTRIYRQLATHFRNKDGQEYNPDQMPVSFNKCRQPQPIVSDLIGKVNRLVRT